VEVNISQSVMSIDLLLFELIVPNKPFGELNSNLGLESRVLGVLELGFMVFPLNCCLRWSDFTITFYNYSFMPPARTYSWSRLVNNFFQSAMSSEIER